MFSGFDTARKAAWLKWSASQTQIRNYMGLRNAADNLVQWRNNFPNIWGKRDVTHLIYVKIKPYLISLLFWQRWRGFKLFPQQKVSDEIKFQNASKRQIKIIYFYVIKRHRTRLSPAIRRPTLFRIWVWDTDSVKVNAIGICEWSQRLTNVATQHPWVKKLPGVTALFLPKICLTHATHFSWVPTPAIK